MAQPLRMLLAEDRKGLRILAEMQPHRGALAEGRSSLSSPLE